MKLKGTPWLYDRITPEVRAVIAIAEPQDVTADIGYSGGWTCRLIRSVPGLPKALIVIGEAYKAPSIALSFSLALLDMESRTAA